MCVCVLDKELSLLFAMASQEADQSRRGPVATVAARRVVVAGVVVVVVAGDVAIDAAVARRLGVAAWAVLGLVVACPVSAVVLRAADN